MKNLFYFLLLFSASVFSQEVGKEIPSEGDCMIITRTASGSWTRNYYTPKFVNSKGQKTFSGTTDSRGEYIVEFAEPYSVAPNIQVSIIGVNLSQVKVLSVTTDGFTIYTYNQNIVEDKGALILIGEDAEGVSIDVLITEK